MFGATGDAEFGEDAVQVVVHCSRGDDQFREQHRADRDQVLVDERRGGSPSRAIFALPLEDWCAGCRAVPLASYPELSTPR
jgi:hypothetical protein